MFLAVKSRVQCLCGYRGSFQHIVINFAIKCIVAQSELIAGDELPTAGNTTETVDVVDFASSSHDEIRL